MALVLMAALSTTARAQSDSPFEQEPIFYSGPEVNDPIARLQKRLDEGMVNLEYDDRHGYLRSVLEFLEIPISSQMLVFSKTSFQRDRISPSTPRALYFNDSAYIGWVQLGEVLEVSAVDPQKGAIFYALPQQRVERPKFLRQTHACLQCHDSSLSQGVPGHFVRSVYPDVNGLPILSAGTFVSSHNSPLSERWGGWYVTGTHGKQTHMGNVSVPRRSTHEPPGKSDLSAGANVTNLGERCDTSPYLTPHSDIVALMVLEHQTHLHNLLTRANHQTRLALRDEVAMNRTLGRPVDERLDSTLSRIKSVCEPLVKYLLFADEAPLADRVEGTSGYAKEFSREGPRDRAGRSLCDFDLEKRMFRYPLSYLIYSEAFSSLPELARDYVYRRLWQVLSGEDKSGKFAHLTEADRRAIVEILRDTKPDLPEYWKR